tara:strand:- start:11093 stop:20389 length:9297 start_codon:yes stop_codon:yes gene_type:complete
MNEDAIRDAYQLFLNNGYRETFDSFKELITSNPDALQDSFTHFQDNGYNDNFDDFKNLMGITTVEEIVQVKKKDDTEFDLEDGSSGLPEMEIFDPEAFKLRQEEKKLKEQEVVGRNISDDDYINPYDELTTMRDGIPLDERNLYPDTKSVDRATEQLLADSKITLAEAQASEPANIERQAAEKLVIDAEITKGIEDRKKILKTTDFELALSATDSDSIDKDGEDAVTYFTNLYGRYGFIFRKTKKNGGDYLEVIAPGSTEVELIGLKTLMSSEEESAKLRNFVSTYARNPNEQLSAPEQDVIDVATKIRNIRSTARINDDGTESTVLLESANIDGNEVVYPTLFPKTTGQRYGSDPMWWMEKKGMEAYKEALKRGEVFTFDTAEAAEEVAEGSWKDVSTIDSEAKLFYADRGLNYTTYRKELDDYEGIMDEITFIEGQRYDLAKAAGKQNTDGSFGSDEMQFREKDVPENLKEKFAYLYVDGKQRSDIAEYLINLKEKAEKLRETVNADEFRTVREDFDVLVDKKLQKQLSVAAKVNYAYSQEADALNYATLNEFGIKAENLIKYKPKTEDEAYRVNQLLLKQSEVDFEKSNAANQYELAKTFLSAKVDKQARGEFVENWSSLSNEWSGGWKNGKANQKILALALGITDMDDDLSIREAAEYIVNYKNASQNKPKGRALSRYHGALTYEERFDAFSDDPFEIATSMAAQSISQMLPYGMKIVAGTVATEAVVGGTMGATGFSAGPIGFATTTAGVVGGAVDGLKNGVAATMVALEYTNSVYEAISNMGYNAADPDEMVKALKDERVWEEGRRIGLARGLTIGAVDRISMGLAGRLFPVGVLAARGTRVAAGVASVVTLDPLSEGLGEYLAQKAAGQEESMADVMDEVVGGFGMSAPFAAVNMFMDGRSRNNINIAAQFENLKFLAESKYSSKRIATWTNSMVELGQITPEAGQRINENIGLRKEARLLLDTGQNSKQDVSTNPALENRVMELLAAKQELSATTNKREIFSETISEIKKELAGIVSSKTLLSQENQTNLEFKTFSGNQTSDVDIREQNPLYTINRKRFTKDDFFKKVKELTPAQRKKRNITIFNDAESIVELNNIMNKDKTTDNAIQESSTTSVDAQEQTNDSSTLGEGTVIKGETTETNQTENQEQTLIEDGTQAKINEEGLEINPLEEEIADIEGGIEEKQNEIVSIREQLKADVAEVRKKKISKEEKATAIQDLKEDAKNEIDNEKETISESKKQIKAINKKLKKDKGVLNEEVSDLESVISEGNPKVDFRMKEGLDGNIDNDIQIEAEEVEIERMNAMVTGNESTTINSGKRVAIDGEELGSRTNRPVRTARLEIIDGVPTVFTISDQLTTGNTTNPNTGNTIDNLKGGLGFTETEGNEGAAWANTTEKEAKDMLVKAENIYRENQNIFDQWWKQNPEHNGLVPLTVVKMGEGSLLSNEATFRVLADNLTLIPKENKVKALEAFIEQSKNDIAALENSIETGIGLKGKKISPLTKAAYGKTIKQKQELLAKAESVESIEQLLDTKVLKTLTLPSRRVLLETIAYGSPNRAGETTKAGKPTKGVPKILLENTPAESRTLLSLAEITDLITDPQMKNVPQRSVVAIQGIDVINPEIIKTTHPNYDWGVKGRNIGVLEESIPIQDAFPTAFNAAIVGLTKDEAKGKTFTDKQIEKSRTEKEVKKNPDGVLEEGQLKPSSVGTILTETIGVQNGLPGLEFIGAITEGNVDNGTKLINFMNTSFPSVAFSTDGTTFNNVVQSEGVKVYLKGDEVLYGVTVNGDIYINPQTHNSDSELFNTAIHEMGHVWTDYLQTTEKGKAIYSKGQELVMQTDEFATQLRKFNGDIAKATNEAMAILIGNKGQTIADASLKSKFQEWLLGMWKSIKEQFKLSSDLTDAEVQALSLDEFLGTALADIFAGKKIKLTDAQLIQMKNPEAAFSSGQSMQGIIDKGRENGFTDASIRVVLKKRGFPMEAVNTAMKVHIDAFLEMPLEFTNVIGGVDVGRALFNTVKGQVNQYASTQVDADITLDANTGRLIDNKRTRTYAEIREKSQELLQANPVFKIQSENTQMELRSAFDRVLGTRANKSVSAEIAAIKNNIRQQKIGADNIVAAQQRLRVLIRKFLPKNTKYSKVEVEKFLRLINSTNPKNFEGKAFLVMEQIVVVREKIRMKMIDDIQTFVKKKSQFKKTESGKTRGKGVDAIGQKYFSYAAQVFKMVLANDFAGLTAYKNSINTDTIELLQDKIAKGIEITNEERFLLDKQLAFDSYADIINMDYYQVESLLQDAKLISKEAIARLNNRRALRKQQTDKIKEDFVTQIKRQYSELFGDKGALLGGNEIINRRASIRKSLEDNGFFGALRAFLFDFTTDLKYSPTGIKKYIRNNIVHLGTLTNVLDRGTTGNMFNDTFYRRLNLADEAYHTGVFIQEDNMDAMAQTIGFDTFNKWKYSLGEESISIDNVLNAKTKQKYKEYGITKDKALRIYALSKNEVQLNKLRKQGFTDAKLKVIRDFVGEDNIKMADMVMDYLSNDYFTQTNDIYIQSNDISLTKVDNYFPTRTQGGDINSSDMLSGDFSKVFSAEFSPALKERVDTTSDIELGFDFSEVFEDHIMQMERFKAYALPVKQLNTILKSPEIQTVLEETGLKKLLATTLNYAINPTSGPKLDQDAVGWIQGRFTGFALAFKPIQTVKQASSAILGFEKYNYRGRGKKKIPGLDLTMLMVDYASVLANLPNEIKEAKKISGGFRNRLKRGLEGDIFGLESGGKRSAPKFRNRKDILGKVVRGYDTAAGVFTILGDILGVLGYKAAFNRDIKNGMPLAEATELFNDYNASQQTRRNTEKNQLQMATTTGSRFFTMFASTLFLLMNKVMISSNNIQKLASEGKVAPASDFRALALAYSGSNALFALASYSGALLRGDDEERREAMKQVMLAASGLSLVYQIPLFGAAVEEAVNRATGNRKPVSEGVNPFLTVFKRTEKAITEASKGEGSIAKVVTPVLELGLGAQLTAPIALGKTFGGDFSDDNIYDLLGITKSYRAGYGVKAKKNGGMTKTQMRRLYPELYKEYYPPKSDEIKEYEKYQKQMYKDFYGQD